METEIIVVQYVRVRSDATESVIYEGAYAPVYAPGERTVDGPARAWVAGELIILDDGERMEVRHKNAKSRRSP